MEKNKYYNLYNENYSENLSAIIKELETLRIEEMKKFIKLSVFYFIISFLLIIFLSFFIKKFFIIIILIISDIILYKFFKNKCNKKFSNKIKNEKMKDLICCFGKITWSGEKSYSNSKSYMEGLQEFGLFQYYRKVYVDDEFYGTYKDIDFVCAELKLDDTSDNETIHKTVFKGIVLKFKTNKFAKNKTVISSKNNIVQKENGRFDILIALVVLFIITLPSIVVSPFLFIGIYLVCVFLCIKGLNNYGDRLEKVVLEDPNFMNKFKLYSSDQVEARYFVTTAFMERFYNLKTVFGAKGIKCSFLDDRLLIAIENNKDFFEIGSLFKSFHDKESIKQFFMELESIYSMIDYFKLGEKTGL